MFFDPQKNDHGLPRDPFKACIVPRPKIVDLPSTPSNEPNTMIIGNVVGIHIDDDVITDGRVDIKKLKPIARLGYSEYAIVGADNIFTMRRPNE